ncbi:MerR family DNA-binding protein, partial [PVC group bacterium]|nr:MerR family DNA-binding protein [PVC group bacterium]
SSGYLIYPKDSVNHIKFIKRAKTLGFLLREISELLSLRVDSKKTCGHVKKQTETKLDEINKKIKSLRQIQKALKNMAKSCQGKGPISKCPILDELNK